MFQLFRRDCVMLSFRMEMLTSNLIDSLASPVEIPGIEPIVPYLLGTPGDWPEGRAPLTLSSPPVGRSVSLTFTSFQSFILNLYIISQGSRHVDFQNEIETLTSNLSDNLVSPVEILGMEPLLSILETHGNQPDERVPLTVNLPVGRNCVSLIFTLSEPFSSIKFQLTKIIRHEAFTLVGAKKVPSKTIDINGISREYQSHVLPDFAGPARFNQRGQLYYQPNWDSDENSVDNVGFISALVESVAAAAVRIYGFLFLCCQTHRPT
jgi:hypothetical protein